MLDVEILEHKQLMDQVNNFVVQHNVPPEFTTKLRRYFIQRKRLDRSGREHELISMLSPMLRARAAESRCEWLKRVPYLANAHVQLITLLEGRLLGQVRGAPAEPSAPPPLPFPPSLAFLLAVAFTPIIRSPSCPRAPCRSTRRRSRSTGRTRFATSRTASPRARATSTARARCGAPTVLENTDLKDRTPVGTLTYVEVLHMTRVSFFDVLEHFPDDRKTVKRWTLMLAIEAMVRVQKAKSKAEGFTDRQHWFSSLSVSGVLRYGETQDKGYGEGGADGAADRCAPLDEVANALAVLARSRAVSAGGSTAAARASAVARRHPSGASTTQCSKRPPSGYTGSVLRGGAETDAAVGCGSPRGRAGIEDVEPG